VVAALSASITGLRVDRVGGVAEMEVGDAQRFLWVAEQENHLVTHDKTRYLHVPNSKRRSRIMELNQA
jgi:hypothetical protein